MLRRSLQRDNRNLYEKLFAFARVHRAEHHSPFLIETAVILGTAVALPAVLLYGCFHAVYRGRRMAAEAEIRETEVGLKKEELKQSKIRTEVQQHMAAAIKAATFAPGSCKSRTPSWLRLRVSHPHP